MKTNEHEKNLLTISSKAGACAALLSSWATCSSTASGWATGRLAFCSSSSAGL